MSGEESEKPELNAQDVQEMTEWFKFFDKDGNGKLDNKELSKVFAALGWNLTDQDQKDVFKKFDIDDSGFIEQDEYIALLKSLKKDKNTEKLELLEAFRKFDTDRSGTITDKELKRFFLSRDMAFTDKDKKSLTALMKKADKDGDGNVDIEEFVSLLMEDGTEEILRQSQKMKI